MTICSIHSQHTDIALKLSPTPPLFHVLHLSPPTAQQRPEQASTQGSPLCSNNLVNNKSLLPPCSNCRPRHLQPQANGNQRPRNHTAGIFILTRRDIVTSFMPNYREIAPSSVQSHSSQSDSCFPTPKNCYVFNFVLS